MADCMLCGLPLAPAEEQDKCHGRVAPCPAAPAHIQAIRDAEPKPEPPPEPEPEPEPVPEPEPEPEPEPKPEPEPTPQKPEPKPEPPEPEPVVPRLHESLWPWS